MCIHDYTYYAGIIEKCSQELVGNQREDLPSEYIAGVYNERSSTRVSLQYILKYPESDKHWDRER